MKYAYKLAMSIMLLLAAVLSIGGYWFLYQDFNDTLIFTQQQNTTAHLRDKFALEASLINIASDELSDDRNSTIASYAADFASYNKNIDVSFAIYSMTSQDKAKAVFSSIPLQISRDTQLAQLAQSDDAVQIIKTSDNTRYMLISTRVSGTDYMWYLSCYNINALFDTRSTKLARFMQIEAVALILAAFASALIAYFLTRSIKKLTAASKHIATGAYNMRTNVKNHDEIGELSRSFDDMAQAISQKIEQLSLNLRQRDDFVSAFTHEIKTPMTSILGYSDMLRSGQYSDDERKMAADYIYTESKRLEELSLKLLSLMKLSEEAFLALAPTRLQNVFAVFEKSLLPYAGRFVISHNNDTVMADMDLLVDLLRNLAINALKASDGAVSISAAKLDNKVVITVSDTGCGISPDALRHITEPFYMADKSRARAQNGSGMGLALGQKIAVLHGTTLSFDSELGKGTNVCFSLMCSKEEDQ